MPNSVTDVAGRPRVLRPVASDVAFDASRGWRLRLAELLLCGATLVNVLVSLATPHFPYSDATNHLARWVLMDRWWSGMHTAYISVHLVPTPYVLGDLLGVLFVHLLGPTGGMRLFIACTVIVLPYGMYRLLQATAPRRRGWALMGAFFGFNAYLMLGNLNFALSLGLTFWWLAYWWKRRLSASWPARLLVAFTAVLLFLVHMAGAVVILAVIGIAWLMDSWRAWVKSMPRRLLVIDDQLKTALAVVVAVGGAWVWTELVNGDMASAGGALVFRDVLSKILAIGYPFFWTSHTQLFIMTLLYAVCVVTFVFVNRKDLRPDPFMVSSVVFFLFYLAFPKAIPSAGSGLDVRWLPVAFLMLFCATSNGTGRVQRNWLAIPFVATLIVAVLAWRTTHGAARALANYDRVLAELPADSTLLPLVSMRKPLGPIQPYWHYGTAYIIQKGGRVPRLFNSTGYRDGDPTEFNLRYFTERSHLYLPADDWGMTPTPEPLDWRRIRREYAYLLLADQSETVQQYVSAHATRLDSVGGIVLFKVPPPESGASGPRTHGATQGAR